jgi:hypothetical protein
MCNTFFCVETFASILSHHMAAAGETEADIKRSLRCFLYFSFYTIACSGPLETCRYNLEVHQGPMFHVPNC